jgi:hypothetical protein
VTFQGQRFFGLICTENTNIKYIKIFKEKNQERESIYSHSNVRENSAKKDYFLQISRRFASGGV